MFQIRVVSGLHDWNYFVAKYWFNDKIKLSLGNPTLCVLL